MVEIPNFIQEAIMGGIRPTIFHDKDQGIVFDMNLMAKSHMHLYERDGQWYASMRYDEEFPVKDVADLKQLARHGMHGRDFISADWAEFLMTDEQRAERQMARDALSKLTPDEQRAVKGYFK